jgi:crossover junction endonuclease EME1
MPPEVISLLSSPEPSRPGSSSYIGTFASNPADSWPAVLADCEPIAVLAPDDGCSSTDLIAREGSVSRNAAHGNAGIGTSESIFGRTWTFDSRPFVDDMPNDSTDHQRQVPVERPQPRPSVNLEGSATQKRRESPEPIDLTSSPERAVLRDMKRHKVSYESEDDPFASSSPLPHRLPTKTLNSSVIALHAEPDLDMCGNHKKRRPAGRDSGWDHISSSAPSAVGDRNCFTAPPRTIARSHTKRMKPAKSEIDDLGDILDTDSSEKEFPGLAELDSSKPWKGARADTLTKPKKRAATSQRNKQSGKEQMTQEKAAKANARAEEKARKVEEMERQKTERRIEKEKAAALAEVNKVRTDKKVSTPEMVTDLPSSLDHAIRLQAETLLADLGVEFKPWTSPVDNVVKWRRKVVAVYKEDLGHWEPVPLRIEDEQHVLVILQAAEFVKLVLGAEGVDVEAHVLKMQVHFPSRRLIYLIEGLTPWMRRNRSLRNRQFTAAVRNGLEPVDGAIVAPPSSQTAPSGRKKTTKETARYVDEEAIEQALLNLQVFHGAMIHHTSAPVETAQWIAIITQHISTIPYKRQKEASNDAAAAFCMESGQVRTGDNAQDTYVRMLQEIVRITAPIAYGIAEEFGSASKLVKGLEEGGPLVLENVRKSANRDGALSDRAVGQAVSRRVYKIFTGRDETSTEV